MRPRILYVDRDSDRDDHQCRIRILKDLQTDYDVDAAVVLTRHVVDLVRRTEAGRPYEAIITHVPPGGPHGYDDSLAILADIIRSTEAAVIAFTCAVGGDFFQISQYADIVVGKSDVPQDLIALRDALRRSVGRRARVRPVEPPQVIYRDGRVVIEAIARLRPGIGGCVGDIIVRECQKFEGEVTLRNLDDDDPDCCANAKSKMDIGLLAVVEDTRLVISVEGIEPVSETLARRLYGILTSRSYCDLRADRFVPP